jgi:carbon monoxide dehydrogenase subunit G
MLVEGKIILKAPIQEVWDIALQADTLAASIPGAEEVVAVDDKTYDAVVKQKVGPIAVKLKFTTTIVEMDPPNYVKLIGRGADVSKAGTFSQETTVHLKEISKKEVEVSYQSNVTLVGRLATFGERIMRAKMKSVLDEFTNNFQNKLKEKIGK